MAQIILRGNPVHTVGSLPAIGAAAPDFVLTRTDMTDVTLGSFAGRKVVLNIFMSLETPVCSTSVRRFNAEIDKYENAVVLCVSMDLPMAHARFCATEGLKNVIAVSELRDRSFGDRYGIRMSDGPGAGLLARAVVVIDEQGKVVYTQLVPEIGTEPDYASALAMLAPAAEALPVCRTAPTAEHAGRPGDDEPCDDGRGG